LAKPNTNGINKNQQGNSASSVDKAIAEINPNVPETAKMTSLSVSAALRESMIDGVVSEETKSVIDATLENLLGDTVTRVEKVHTNAAEEETAKDDENDENTETEGEAEQNVNSNAMWQEQAYNVLANDNSVNKNAVMLAEKLDKLGLLGAVSKLSQTENLSQASIEKAAITLHMIINGLTNEQATVVNTFYNLGVDIMEHVTNQFSAVQMHYIGAELRAGHDVTVISSSNEFSVSQMLEIQKSVCKGLRTDYITTKHSPAVLGVLRKAVDSGVDVKEIAVAAENMSGLEVEMLVSLAYFGIDITGILSDKNALTAEVLLSTLTDYYTKRDAVKFEISADGSDLVRVQG